MKPIKYKTLLDTLFPKKIEAYTSIPPNKGGMKIIYCEYRLIPIYRTLKKFYYSGGNEGKWSSALFENPLEAGSVCTFLRSEDMLKYWYRRQRQVEFEYIQELPQNKKIKIRKRFPLWYL